VNHVYASCLFDTGADKSFVSLEFEKLLISKRTKLPKSITVEVANGKSITVDSILQDCELNFNDHTFPIDLIPMQLGSFDIIVGMDWLQKFHAEIVCFEKLIRLPLPSGDQLCIYGERPSKGLKLMSCTKSQQVLAQGVLCLSSPHRGKEGQGKERE